MPAAAWVEWGFLLPEQRAGRKHRSRSSAVRDPCGTAPRHEVGLPLVTDRSHRSNQAGEHVPPTHLHRVSADSLCAVPAPGCPFIPQPAAAGPSDSPGACALGALAVHRHAGAPGVTKRGLPSWICSCPLPPPCPVWAALWLSCKATSSDHAAGEGLAVSGPSAAEPSWPATAHLSLLSCQPRVGPGIQHPEQTRD